MMMHGQGTGEWVLYQVVVARLSRRWRWFQLPTLVEAPAADFASGDCSVSISAPLQAPTVAVTAHMGVGVQSWGKVILTVAVT